MKLFDQVRDPKPKLGDVVRITTEDDSNETESVSIDEQVAEFNNHVKAFNSLNVIDEQIASENYNFIDKGNYVLYNEYIKSITSNLNMKTVPIISQEALDTLPTTALNHHVALEGFIGDMWNKIKEIFRKIYDSIKEFFTKYFTRLGRLKNKISNLIEVLSETDKDIQKPYIDKVPGSLAAKYPVKGQIDSSVVAEVYNNLAILINSFDEINSKAETFASKDILEKDFVAKILKLKNEINDTNAKLGQNKEAQDGLGSIKKHIPGTDDNSKNKELNKDNKSLEKDAMDKSNQLDNKKDEIGKITAGESDLDIDDKKSEEAKKEFMAFLKTLEDVLGKVKGKPLIKGKIIKEIKISEDSGIELEIEDNKETPDGVRLDDKDSLIKLLKIILEGIEQSEKLATVYGKINDKIMDNMNAVDKLINDLNKIPDESLGKYKKLLNNKVKVRLNMAKTFFNNYNKICKNVLEMMMDTGDGCVEYSVLSLKNFG